MTAPAMRARTGRMGSRGVPVGIGVPGVVGTVFAEATVTIFEMLPDCPVGSVTVRVTWYWPADEYVCMMRGAELVS